MSFNTHIEYLRDIFRAAHSLWTFDNIDQLQNELEVVTRRPENPAYLLAYVGATIPIFFQMKKSIWLGVERMCILEVREKLP